MHPHNVRDSSFYLKKDDSGEFSLSMNYDYYFQIQGQLAICDLEYSDFVCWTLHVMHCERIVADTDHFLKRIQPSLDNFFLLILLLRLLTGSVRRANDFTVVQPMQDSPLPPPIHTVGAVEKMKERWWLAIMSRVQDNGFTSSVLEFHTNPKGNGFVPMIVKQVTHCQMHPSKSIVNM